MGIDARDFETLLGPTLVNQQCVMIPYMAFCNLSDLVDKEHSLRRNDEQGQGGTSGPICFV